MINSKPVIHHVFKFRAFTREEPIFEDADFISEYETPVFATSHSEAEEKFLNMGLDMDHMETALIVEK